MKRSTMIGVCTAAAVIVTLTGCGRPPLVGPPELRLGRDECADCGMLVSEDRCSAALLIERDGVREHAIFDDLGCLLDFENEPPEGVVVIEAFARDYDTRQWVSAGHAHVLFADRTKLKTPMGFGIVACSARNNAERMQGLFGGEIVDWSGAKQKRREKHAAPIQASPGS